MSDINDIKNLPLQITGILTDCNTNVEHEVKLGYIVGDGYLKLVGGPTGYESLNIDTYWDHFDELESTGWCACMGTPGEWDKLVIPGPELKLLASVLEAKTL